MSLIKPLVKSCLIIHMVLLESVTILGAVLTPCIKTFFTFGFSVMIVTPSVQTAWEGSFALFTAITVM